MSLCVYEVVTGSMEPASVYWCTKIAHDLDRLFVAYQYVWRRWKGEDSLRGSFLPSTLHFLSVPCVQISLVKICNNAKKLLGSLYGVPVCMVLHFVYNNGCLNGNWLTGVIMIWEMAVYMGPAECWKRRPPATDGKATNLKSIALYIHEYHYDQFLFDAFCLRCLLKVPQQE